MFSIGGFSGRLQLPHFAACTPERGGTSEKSPSASASPTSVPYLERQLLTYLETRTHIRGRILHSHPQHNIYSSRTPSLTSATAQPLQEQKTLAYVSSVPATVRQRRMLACSCAHVSSRTYSFILHTHTCTPYGFTLHTHTCDPY